MSTISILMAVYKPDAKWLKEQLASLKQQTWPDLELLVQDDCPENPVGIQAFETLKERMRVKYQINSCNMGPAKTFAHLVEQATGEYIAFCDQDDIWEPEKLEKLYNVLNEQKAALAYCDLCVIDKESRKTADDVRQVRRGDVFLEGEKISSRLFVKNCIYGCSLLMPAPLAKEALPLPEGMGHDHWFSLWAASKGKVVHFKEPLVRYRLHGNNQSDTLRRISTKKDYLEQRIITMQNQAAQCKSRFPHDDRLEKRIQDVGQWAQARRRWFTHDITALPKVWQGRRFSKKAVLFEVIMAWMPETVFKRIIKRL